MKLTDRILGIPDHLATPETPHYEEAKTGLQRAGVGLAATIGGLAYNALTGSEAGIDVAAAGSIVLAWGGAEMTLHADAVRRQVL